LPNHFVVVVAVAVAAVVVVVVVAAAAVVVFVAVVVVVAVVVAVAIVVARIFRILHPPIIKDAETVRFGILLQCHERSIVILNYNASCSGTPYEFSTHPLFTKIRKIR
jgi:hypothetical protein